MSVNSKEFIEMLVSMGLINNPFWIEYLGEQGMNKSMGHFTNWKFGVPVRVHEINPGGVQRCVEARLVSETDNYFAIIYGDSNMQIAICNKANFYYELISYKIASANPRYLVCQLPTGNGMYCNSYDRGAENIALYGSPPELAPEPTATLKIDGKEIELSAETAARLKKELGI